MTVEPALGTLTRRPGAVEARIERDFAVSPQRLWAALTREDLLCQWLAPGRIATQAGGEARLDFQDSGIVVASKVTACEPGRLLEYSWSGPGEPHRPLRWQVNETAQGAKLVLTLRVPDTEDAPRAAAGFEAHLDMLAAALEGVPVKFPFLRFKELREAYKARLPAA